MKKWICGILAAALLLPVLSATAFAAGHGYKNGHHGSGCAQTETRRCVKSTAAQSAASCAKKETCAEPCRYVDENGDGICDNCKNQCTECNAVLDENGDGICDKCKKRCHYRDADNDGICDQQETCGQRKNAVHRNAAVRKGHHNGHNGKHH